MNFYDKIKVRLYEFGDDVKQLFSGAKLDKKTTLVVTGGLLSLIVGCGKRDRLVTVNEEKVSPEAAAAAQFFKDMGYVSRVYDETKNAMSAREQAIRDSIDKAQFEYNKAKVKRYGGSSNTGSNSNGNPIKVEVNLQGYGPRSHDTHRPETPY